VKGSETLVPCTIALIPLHTLVYFSILCLILRGLLRLAGSNGDPRDREVEILVLRHQVRVALAQGRSAELTSRDVVDSGWSS
jgi:hypothetical protein